MRKKVWIFNHYAGGMYFNKGGRHYWFSKFLQREGYESVVFCANTTHDPAGKFFIDSDNLWVVKKDEDINTPFVFVKASMYYKNGFKRILNMFSFYLNVKKVAREYASKYGKPDVILASSVHPLTLIAGEEIAKYFGVKCICEVRDLWPEAIVTYSKRITKNSFLAKLLYAGEKWIYKNASAVIFTQEGGPDYIKWQKWDKEQGGPIDLNNMYHINNGIDLEAFDINANKYIYEDEDLDNPGLFKVVYAGAIRRINNLGIILDTAKIIQNDKVKFIIFGDGDELEILKKRVIDENITNVVFKGRVNKQYIPSIDKKADLNLVHWEMSPLLRVGESYNKAFEYFAAGKPVFYTIRPGYSIVEKFGCGKLTEGFTAEDIARGIESIVMLNDEERKILAKNARKAAEYYDFKNLTKKLADILEKYF